VIEVAEQLGMTTELLQVLSGTYAEARGLSENVITSGAQAVIAFDDVIAHGVLDGLDDHGVRVPHDIRVLGCDDALPIQTRPRLSTIRLQSEAAVRAAIRMLTDAGQTVQEQRIEFPGELKLRETT
jgi:LacI family transcriptional regulator